MILVEGLDNTGKTTLVSDLALRYPELAVRPSIGNKHDLSDIRKQAQDEAHGLPPLTIADRSRIVSEYIYGPILKSRPLAYPFDLWMTYLSGFLHHRHLVIYCTRPLEKLQATFDEREQLSGVYENLEDLYATYQDFMDALRLLFSFADPVNPCKVLLYDFEVDGWLDLICKAVEDYMVEVSR